MGETWIPQDFLHSLILPDKETEQYISQLGHLIYCALASSLFQPARYLQFFILGIGILSTLVWPRSPVWQSPPTSDQSLEGPRGGLESATSKFLDLFTNDLQICDIPEWVADTR